MCPKLKDGLCEIASIEPERISCADEKCCKGDDWDSCRVYKVLIVTEL